MNDPQSLTINDFAEAADPISLFAEWLAAATASEPDVADAMTLATVDADGWPDARIVLLKEAGEAGFVFYTNRRSRKGRELAANPRAALVFHWKSRRRQVRVRGAVEMVSEAASDAYFASRARDSQIGAWGSQQSEPLESRATFEAAVAAAARRFPAAVPRPPHWGGYRVVPAEIEFWQDRPFRLHDRVLFTRGADGGWDRQRLYP
ncbi:MAG TPA: pyridoxamine 5'-phosphate oxidase [Hyphomicrobiales bacterium]|nr:pyridoxamine 5'-phosphate oxidase [Hyphomicrobiales bacterium]